MLIKAGRHDEDGGDIRAITFLEPLSGREGYAFFLCAAERQHGRDLRAFAVVVEEAGRRLAQSFGKESNVQHRFEQFLSALNDTLATESQAGTWHLPIEAVHAVVGVACDREMYLSGTGEPTAIFLHRERGGRYQIFNLSRGIRTEQAKPTWEKPFAVILDGELADGDVFCTASRDFQTTIGHEDLHTILTTLPPGGAAEKLRQYFPASAPLAAVILRVEERPTIAPPPANDAEHSVERLEETEEETSRLLSDARPSLFERLFGGGRKPTAWRRLGQLAVLLWKQVAKLGNVAASVRRLLKREERREQLRETRRRVRRHYDQMTGRVKGLPPRSRVLFAVALALLIALGFGIWFLNRSQADARAEAAYEQQFKAAETKKEEAAAAAIYRDETRARALYAEAGRLTEALPRDTEARQKKADALRAEIEAAQNELRKISTIEEPPVVGDFASLGNGAKGRALVASGTRLFVFADNERVYELDTAKKSLTPVQTTDGEVGAARQAAEEDGDVLFLDDRPGLSRFNPETATQQVTGLAPTEGARWTDLAMYGDKVYVLEPASGTGEGQVWRYGRSAGAFSDPIRWIKSRTDSLADAVSLAIDGSIFVLKGDGKIVRFVGGSEIAWDAGAVDPALTSASRIWTAPESDYVYVLDAAGGRLVVLRKSMGGVVRQYSSPAFAEASDFLVDEGKRAIYLTAGDKVYAITAAHLQ